MPKGRAISTENGSDHFSYCAARTKNTMMAASPSASPDVPRRFLLLERRAGVFEVGAPRATFSARLLGTPRSPRPSDARRGAREYFHRLEVVVAAEESGPDVYCTSPPSAAAPSRCAPSAPRCADVVGTLAVSRLGAHSTCHVRPYLLKSLT